VFQGRISFCGKSAAAGAVAGFGCCLEELIREKRPAKLRKKSSE
jgi:hypothetical protein